MKLWDYMGIRRPIVANTNVPELTLWRDYIYLADHPTEFVANIHEALSDPTWQADERYAIAMQHTWEKQFQKVFLPLIKELKQSVYEPIS